LSDLGPAGRTASTWYVRRNGDVRGPYPAGIIGSYLILGRIAIDDEVSLDGERWRPVESHPELIPELLRDTAGDPHRLMAARRWHDERRRGDRRRSRSTVVEDDRRHSGDRRCIQPAETRRRHVPEGDIVRSERRRRRRDRHRVAIAAVSIAAVVGALLAYRAGHPPPGSKSDRDCRAPAAPGVDWSHCSKPGIVLEGGDLSGARLIGTDMSRSRLMGGRFVDADLSYADLHGADLRGADLSGARLVGVDLREADLTGSRLQGANLLYADLRGARLDDEALRDAALGQAIWTDGRLCASGSKGRCRFQVDGSGEAP